MTSAGFLSELRRRRVLPVAGAYVVVAWLVTEIAEFLMTQVGAPAWALRLLAIVFIVGFPLAVVLTWVIQKEPGGKRVIDSSKGQGRIVVGAVALGVLITAGLAWLILPRLEKSTDLPAYHPIPNSVGILPLAAPDAAPGARSVAQTLFTALREGLYQSPELALIRLDLDETPEDPAAFGREYRIAALLMGKIVQESGGTRIGIELLDVGQDVVLWSRTFNWDPTRIMDIGTAIANQVLESMELPTVSRQRFSGTDNRNAYEALLRGHEHFSSFRVEDIEAAIKEFQRAIDLEPGFVRAYTSLGSALKVYINVKGPPEPEREALRERAKLALERAVELDDRSADAISALGWITPDRELRIELYEHALELDPNHEASYHRLGYQMWGKGDLDEAERLFRKAVDLNPLNANNRCDLGEILWDLGRIDGAVLEVQMCIELEPGMALGYRVLGLIEMFSNGRIDQGIIHGRTAYSLDSENGGLAGFVAGGYAGLGAREETLAWLDRALQISPTSGWSLMMAHLAHMMLGDKDTALAYAEKILEVHPVNHRALFYVGKRDVVEGRVQRALERWQQAYPLLKSGGDRRCDLSNYQVFVAYADNLKLAGRNPEAVALVKDCKPILAQLTNRGWPESRDSRSLALMGKRQDALDALRREIIDEHGRIEESFTKDQPAYDYLRDEPEFQELMRILRDDLAKQLERVRQMERNGELAPAPGVDLPGL